jgi:hypothetical protein
LKRLPIDNTNKHKERSTITENTGYKNRTNNKNVARNSPITNKHLKQKNGPASTTKEYFIQQPSTSVEVQRCTNSYAYITEVCIGQTGWPLHFRYKDHAVNIKCNKETRIIKRIS